jgi:hypothetical protein
VVTETKKDELPELATTNHHVVPIYLVHFFLFSIIIIPICLQSSGVIIHLRSSLFVPVAFFFSILKYHILIREPIDPQQSQALVFVQHEWSRFPGWLWRRR